MGKLGGRKFISYVLALGFLMGIFAVMLIKSWLTAEYCMRFAGLVPVIVGLFMGGNVATKYINQKVGGKNGQ